MSRAEDERDAVEVSRLLAGAAKTIASVRYCWLVTAAETGGANSRPMGRLQRDPDESDWKMRFIPDGRSRKASDIRRDGKVAIIFQHDADDAFVTLIGTAKLRGGASEDHRHWKDVYNVFVPTRRTERTQASLRSTSSACSCGSAASRRSRSDSIRRSWSGMSAAPGG